MASRPYRSKAIKPQTPCTFLTKPKARKHRSRTNNQIISPLEPSPLLQNEVVESVINHDQRERSGLSEELALAPNPPFTPLQLDDIDLSFLARIGPRYLITEKHIKPGSEHFNSSTSMHDRTCLYSGISSDQGPSLLRHLVYDQLDCFGNDRQLFWRVEAQEDSAYMIVYPSHHLDGHADMYEYDHIEAVFTPHQTELVDLYFTYVHTSFPVLESRSTFEKKRANSCLPVSLLALVYLHGSAFWHIPHRCIFPLIDQHALHPYIYSCLTFEARTPNLEVIQALLLYTQLPARFNRAPNYPGIWSTTSLLTGMAQDIGLHIDPSGWSIIPEERKLRRILWWAVLLHEKTMAHWLGRPSHIKWDDWNVEPLQLKDFADEDGRMEVECVSWANAFIALTNLALIFSDLLDSFYSVRSNFQTMKREVALQKGRLIKDKIQVWRETHGIASGTNAHAYHYTAHLTALTIELSTQRAILGSKMSVEQDSHDTTIEDIYHTITQTLFNILDSRLRHPVSGLCLNYNKGSLSMIGSLLISLVLSSTSEIILNERRTTLLEFHARLQLLVNEDEDCQSAEFAQFALGRVNLILEELFGNHRGSSATERRDPNTTKTPWGNETNEKFWISYRIAFP
ncbi:hypothetical protein K504DRAFT_503517 [Pleomassaria siparia CBS 279.74]|uniref:Xylanolytic transcriptional activator regulatory domain-containing protein n=1 Tax=Pleomassaria siparia CBS 279.74 TaxID=1314801 RepID=A0A6G1K699_9PLEO|nr:hypothetical protein K504DRAFT_503517 [Pleomassaria siparia CBS 279.74]